MRFLVCHDTLACSAAVLSSCCCALGEAEPIEVPAIDSRLTGTLAAEFWQLTECCSC